jgi:thioesterase domain-containing protein
MQASFVKARLQVFFRPFLRAPHRFLPHEFAELVWTLSQQTILDFLKTVPQERQLRVRFEDLVRDPRGAMEQAATFLGLAFDPAMLEPQADSLRRMTDPLAPLARMLGDVRFHEHQGIDRDAADRWQVDVGAALLGEPTWQIAEAFGYERPKSKSLARRPSPRDLLVPLQTPGTLPPIVWIHPPGGIVICYHALARLLGPDRPVFAVRGRGTHGEAPPHDSVEEMARDYVDEIVAGCPDGVVHLGGWSAGGVIALEVARQLRARGRDVGLVALLDSSIPVDTTQFPEDVSGLPPAVEYGLDISLVELARRPPSEQMEYILNHARQLGLVKPDTPLHLVKDTLDNLSRLFHAHVEAVQHYQLPADLGRITLFRPQEALSVEGARRDSGWSEFAAVDVRMVPGSHYTMVKEPHVRALAEQVNEALRLVEREARQSPASAAPRGNE